MPFPTGKIEGLPGMIPRRLGPSLRFMWARASPTSCWNSFFQTAPNCDGRCPSFSAIFHFAYASIDLCHSAGMPPLAVALGVSAVAESADGYGV